jgi:hypothetical protein
MKTAFKHILIKPASIITFRYLYAHDRISWDRKKDASLQKDRKPIVHTPTNFAVVMGVYPMDAKSESFRFQLN